jgi:iron(III) transport system substrate-binding protein
MMATGSRAATSTNTADLYAAAKKEGKLVWWCGTYDHPTIDALRGAFMATYPGIEVDYIWATGEVVYTRIQQNLQAGVKEVDVFSTSNAGHWPLLKKQNVLTPFRASNASSLSAPFRNVDPDDAFRANGVEVVVVNYRSDKITTPPSRWTDFLKPEWAGKLTLGSPVFSGDMVNWTVAMIDKYGDKFLAQLAKTNPKVGRSILGTGTDILSGERLVGAGLVSNTTLLRKGGNPIAVRVPDDDAILAFGYTGILKDAPHPNAAKLLMEFTASKAYSQTLTKTYRFPLRDDVASSNGLTLKTMKTYKSTIERLATGTSGAIAQWNAALGI